MITEEDLEFTTAKEAVSEADSYSEANTQIRAYHRPTRTAVYATLTPQAAEDEDLLALTRCWLAEAIDNHLIASSN